MREFYRLVATDKNNRELMSAIFWQVQKNVPGAPIDVSVIGAEFLSFHVAKSSLLVYQARNLFPLNVTRQSTEARCWHPQ